MTPDQRIRMLRFLSEPDPATQDEPLPQADDAAEKALDARLVQAVLAAQRAEAARARPEAVPPDELAARRRRFTRGALMSLLSIAAAGLLAWNLRATERYEVALSGGDHEMGASTRPSGEDQLLVGGRITIELKPRRTGGAPDTEVYSYLRKGEQLARWNIGFQRKESGALLFDDVIGRAPLLGAGEWEAIFVVGRAGHLPDDAEVETIVRRGAPASTRYWEFIRKTLRVGTAPDAPIP